MLPPLTRAWPPTWGCASTTITEEPASLRGDGRRKPAGARADDDDVGFAIPLGRQLLRLRGPGRPKARAQCRRGPAPHEQFATIQGHGNPPVQPGFDQPELRPESAVCDDTVAKLGFPHYRQKIARQRNRPSCCTVSGALRCTLRHRAPRTL